MVNVDPYLPRVLAGVCGASVAFLVAHYHGRRLDGPSKVALSAGVGAAFALAAPSLAGRVSNLEMEKGEVDLTETYFWEQVSQKLGHVPDERCCLPLFNPHTDELWQAGLVLDGQPVFAGFSGEVVNELVDREGQIDWWQVHLRRQQAPIRLLDEEGNSIPLNMDGVEQLLAIPCGQDQVKLKCRQVAQEATATHPLKITYTGKQSSAWFQFGGERLQLGEDKLSWVAALRVTWEAGERERFVQQIPRSRSW